MTIRKPLLGLYTSFLILEFTLESSPVVTHVESPGTILDLRYTGTNLNECYPSVIVFISECLILKV